MISCTEKHEEIYYDSTGETKCPLCKSLTDVGNMQVTIEGLVATLGWEEEETNNG